MLAVDGNFATEETVENVSVGNDKPGTLVTLTAASARSSTIAVIIVL